MEYDRLAESVIGANNSREFETAVLKLSKRESGKIWHWCISSWEQTDLTKEVILIADIFLNELTGRGMAKVGNSNSNVTAKWSEIRKLWKGDETSLYENGNITRSIQLHLVLMGKCICCVNALIRDIS